MPECRRVARGIAVERFDVEHAECLVDVVGSHRRSSSVAHEPRDVQRFRNVLEVQTGRFAITKRFSVDTKMTCTRIASGL